MERRLERKNKQYDVQTKNLLMVPTNRTMEKTERNTTRNQPNNHQPKQRTHMGVHILIT